MTDPILLQFIDKVYQKNLDYCVICLRTSEERRLEKPVYLKKFIENVTNINEQCFKFNRAYQLVCFVCERQAAAAFRFLAALGLATHAHTTVQRLNESPALRCQFHTSYIQYVMSNPRPTLAPDSMLHLESRLRQQRMKSQLLLTEVLMVSTPCADDNIPDKLTSECEVTSGPGESRDMYVIPDLMPVRGETTCDTLDIKTESEIKVEPVVIHDDDDPISIESSSLPINTGAPTTTAPATPGSESLAPRIGMPLAIMDRTQKNETRKHIPETRTVIIPIEQLQENQSVPLVVSVSTTSFILHPLVFNSGMMTVPSLSANIMEGQLITSDRHTLTFETPDLAMQDENKLRFVTDPEKVKSILKKLSHHDASKVFIFRKISDAAINASENFTSSIPPELDRNPKNIDTVNSRDKNNPDCNKVPTICTVGEARSLESEVWRDGGVLARESEMENGRMPSKESRVRDGLKGSETPQLRSDRIDWEDKIPMDVISFVDEDETTCKRSRPSNYPPPPIGITNVTSLSQVDDVIDLC